MSFLPVDQQLEVLRRGTVDLVHEGELRARLQESRDSGKPLRIKLGIDPSSPDIHLGHTVVLRKLRDFQRLGHTAIVLWGTSTAMVGFQLLVLWQSSQELVVGRCWSFLPWMAPCVPSWQA